MNKLIAILVVSTIGSCLVGYWGTGLILCVALVVLIPIAMFWDLTKKKEKQPLQAHCKESGYPPFYTGEKDPDGQDSIHPYYTEGSTWPVKK